MTSFLLKSNEIVLRISALLVFGRNDVFTKSFRFLQTFSSLYLIFIFQNKNGLSHLLVPSPSCNDWGIDLKSRQNSAGRLKFSALLLQGAAVWSQKTTKSTKNLVKLPRPLKTVSPVCSSYYCSYLSSQKSWCTHMLGLYVTCWNYTALSAYSQ